MIRNKLILAYLIPSALLLGIMGVLIYAQARASLEGELGLRLEAVAQTAVGSLPSGEPRRLAKLTAEDEATLKRLREKLEAIRAAAGARRVFIVDRDLKSLVDTRQGVRFGDPLFELQADRVEMERVFEPPFESASSVLFVGQDGTRYKNGYAPLIHEGQCIGAVGVEGSAAFFEAIAEFQALMFAVGLLSLLAIVLVSVLVARSFNQPIVALEEAARRFGRGDLSADARVERRDEFQTLADAFNEMRQDLLDRDRQMQMMLAGIAHEVRNPLGGIELFCGLLAEDVEPMTDQPQLADYTGRIRRELHTLKRVVNDFLDYARHSAPEVTRFEADGLLSGVAQVMAHDLESWGVGLEVQPASGLELTADRDTLHRALINLVRNAGQAGGDGLVTLQCREIPRADPAEIPELAGYEAHAVIPPQAPHAGSWRALLVRDEGSGISSEALESIFEAFFTTREKGSGLGLALTRKVVAEHGGGLMVGSSCRAQGGGTLMILVLPFKEEIEAAKMEIPEGWLG